MRLSNHHGASWTDVGNSSSAGRHGAGGVKIASSKVPKNATSSQTGASFRSHLAVATLWPLSLLSCSPDSRLRTCSILQSRSCRLLLGGLLLLAVAVASVSGLIKFFVKPPLSSDSIKGGFSSLSLLEANLSANYKATGYNSVAICLFGGARTSEITLPTFYNHVLKAYSPADIFINTHLDENAVKIALLFTRLLQQQQQQQKPHGFPNGSQLQAVRVRPNMFINESQFATHLFNPEASNGGVQGLLQQFFLIEGCWNLIVAHEKKRQLKYEWVVKTRLDSFWTAPPPPLSSLNPRAVTAPLGSDFKGINDRFSICGREVCDWSLRPVSLLPRFEQLENATNLDGEKVLHWQLRVGKVRVERVSLSFCFPPSRVHGVLYDKSIKKRRCSDMVYSIHSRGALNGAYCTKCDSCMDEAETLSFFASKNATWRATFAPNPNMRGLLLCGRDSIAATSSKRQELMLEAVEAEIRQMGNEAMSRNTFLEDCMQDVHRFMSLAHNWMGGTASEICVRSQLGLSGRGKTLPTPYNVFFSALKKSVFFVLEDMSGFNLQLRLLLSMLFRASIVSSMDSMKAVMKNFTDVESTRLTALQAPYDMFEDVRTSLEGVFPFCQVYTTIPTSIIQEIVLSGSLVEEFGLSVDSCIPSLNLAYYSCTLYSPTHCAYIRKK